MVPSNNLSAPPDAALRARQSADRIPELRQLLALLWESYLAAQELGCDACEFALQLTSLRTRGISDSAVRLLFHQEMIDHLCETTRRGQRRRSFRAVPNTAFTATSCFVLTPLGAATAQGWLTPEREAAPGREPGNKPYYDAGQRTLFVGDRVVKRFRVPATNQELILLSLQEEGWPSRLNDPLPPRKDVNPKQRLHDTIKRLNRHQGHARIHFNGDGTGRGVHWQIVGFESR